MEEAVRKAGRTFEEAGRELMLKEREVVAHALRCPVCGMRGQALLALLLVGWSEELFLVAATTRGLAEAGQL